MGDLIVSRELLESLLDELHGSAYTRLNDLLNGSAPDLLPTKALDLLDQMVTVVVEGDPVAKGRARASSIGGFVRMFTPKATRDYEEACANEARATMEMLGRAPLTGPLELNLQIFMPIPKSYSKGKSLLCRLLKMVPTKKPDSSNILKAVEDAFNGIVWIDDAQIVDHHITKRFSDNPCVIANVRVLDLQCC